FVFLGGRRKSGGVGRKVTASDLGGIICLLATSPRAVALSAHLTIDAALTHRTNYRRVTPRSFERVDWARSALLPAVARASIVGIADFPLPGTRSNAARHFLRRAPARSIDVSDADHAGRSPARSNICSSARTGTRSNRPILIVGISP